MKTKTLVLGLLLVVGLLMVGCASEGSGSYQAPSGPIGGGCGIQAPAGDVGVAGAVAAIDVVGA
jgi:hypothetical protein|tara:strand:+ start:321 stop:512 length:192 start_codon:yes stop_codon:yes gene_type:complete